jgi:hypothetical protein
VLLTYASATVSPCRGERTAEVTEPAGFASGPAPPSKSSVPAAGGATSPRRIICSVRFTCPRSRMRTITSCPV